MVMSGKSAKSVDVSLAIPVEINEGGVVVRVVGDNDKPQFVAADVAAALGIQNIRQVMTTFDDDEKSLYAIHTEAGSRSVATVYEPGLYRIVSSSRKPAAKAFQRWLYHDVLPCIRKHGCYPAPTEERDGVIDDMDRIIVMCQRLKEVRAAQQEADRRLREVQQTADDAKFIAVAALKRCEGDHGYVSLLGYCNLTGRTLSRQDGAAHGKKLGKLCRERGIDRGQCGSERDGKVRSYPKWLLAEYFGDDESESLVSLKTPNPNRELL